MKYYIEGAEMVGYGKQKLKALAFLFDQNFKVKAAIVLKKNHEKEMNPY